MFQEIFNEVVRQCIAKGLVAGKHLSFDGTTIQANASYESMVTRRIVEMSPAEYMQKVEQENPVGIEGEQEPHPASDQRTAPKEPGVASGSNEGVALKPSASPTDGTDTRQRSSVFADGGRDRSGKLKRPEEKTNATHISRTDPEARIFARPGQPKKLGYIECITVDSLYKIVTGVEVIPGNADEARVLVPSDVQVRLSAGFRIRRQGPRRIPRLQRTSGTWG